jgi:hypothetical protein
MAAIPPIAYVSAASKVLVLTAGLRYGRRLPPARRWIFAWALIGLLIDGAMLVYALRKQNNHWMSYVAAPVEVSTLLFALSCWHLDRGRQILRTLAVAFVATVVVLVVFVESLTTFSLVRGPIESILIVAASLATLLLLLRDEQGNLFQRDWFWICAGLSLRYGALATLGPLGRMLIGESPDLVISMLKVRAVVNIVSNVVIARGVWCPLLPLRSSGPTSPVSSPSLSSSPPSARGW